MLGWDTEDSSFVIELVFQYGNTSKKGSQFNYSLIFYKTNEEGEDMEAKLKELFPNAKPDEEEGIYSIINDDIKVIFADMKAEAKSTLFSIVLAVSDIPETIAFYEKFGV